MCEDPHACQALPGSETDSLYSIKCIENFNELD